MRVYVGPDATLKLHHDMQKGSGETFEDLTGGAPPPEREVRREREDDEDEDRSVGAEAQEEPTTARPASSSSACSRRTPRSTSTVPSADPPARPHRCGSRRDGTGSKSCVPASAPRSSEVEVPAGRDHAPELMLERPEI